MSDDPAKTPDLLTPTLRRTRSRTRSEREREQAERGEQESPNPETRRPRARRSLFREFASEADVQAPSQEEESPFSLVGSQEQQESSEEEDEQEGWEDSSIATEDLQHPIDEPDPFEDPAADPDEVEQPQAAIPAIPIATVTQPQAQPQPQAQQPVNVQMNQSKDVTIGGLTVKVSATPSTSRTGSLAVFKKEDRSTLSVEKRQELFARITQAGQQQYELLNQAISSIDDLQETYDLQLTIETTRGVFARYDMLDVFSIVFPVVDANGEVTVDLLPTSTTNSSPKVINLFDDFMKVKPADVAHSSIWYCRWVDHNDCPWIKENLTLSHDYFQNNVKLDLWGKIAEETSQWKGTQAMGGPLVFIVMMHLIQANSILVIQSLHTKLKSLKISAYQGENVSTLVSHARSLINRLKSLERKNPDGTPVYPVLPTDLAKTLTRLFQTSSDITFNNVFIRREMEAYEKSLESGDAAYGDPNMLLSLAVRVYTDRVQSEEGWTGALHKANETGFVANAKDGEPKKPKCFNCGGDHMLPKCPVTVNEDRVKQAREEFWRGKPPGRGGRGSGGRTGGRTKGRGGRDKQTSTKRWPPAPTDHAKNEAKIRGAFYFYHFKDQRWKKCPDQSPAKHPHAVEFVTQAPKPASAAATTPAAAPVNAPATMVPPSDDSSSQPSGLTSQSDPRQAANALVTQINTAMQAFQTKL